MKKNNNVNCNDVKQKNSLMLQLLIGMGVVIVALGIAVAVLTNEFVKTRSTLENDYSRSLYEASDNLSNMETNLGKFLASNDGQKRESLAFDVYRQSQSASSSLAALPLGREGADATRFVNQLGDYCYYAGKKAGRGEKLSDKEMENLSDMQQRCEKISTELKNLVSGLGGKYRIVNHLEGATLAPKDTFGKSFNTVTKENVDYPVLIYDGPFSDAADKRDYKHIKDLEEISAEQGEQVVRAIFSGEKIKSVALDTISGDVQNDAIKIYGYTVQTPSCTKYVQITAKGGKLLQLSGYRSIDGVVLSEDEAKEKAVSFARRAGFSSLKPVWIQVSGRAAFVNLAPQADGAVLYPDLVKVKVALDSGEVLGVEATNYLLNHTEREMLTAMLSPENAEKHLNTTLKVTETRLALIPTDTGGEELAYEFYCENGGLSFMIYINANTGAEINILRVVDTAQGRLLV